MNDDSASFLHYNTVFLRFAHHVKIMNFCGSCLCHEWKSWDNTVVADKTTLKDTFVIH